MSDFDLLARLGGGRADGAGALATCSRASCTAEALYRVEWRNPRIHSADRVKTWLACADHLDYLRGFLRDRDFPVRVHGIDDDPDEEPIA